MYPVTRQKPWASRKLCLTCQSRIARVLQFCGSDRAKAANGAPYRRGLATK
jgi:hypothetical protein